MKRRTGIVAIVALVVVFCFAISAYAAPAPKPPSDVNVVSEPATARDVNVVTDPLPVTSVDSYPREPFTLRVEVNIPDGTADWTSDIFLPGDPSLDKVLVFENIAAQALVPASQVIRYVLIYRHNGASRLAQIHNIRSVYTTASTYIFDTLKQVRLYADPGSILSVEASRSNSSGSASVLVDISGYSVPVGSPTLGP
jgi:hypothetical protein